MKVKPFGVLHASSSSYYLLSNHPLTPYPWMRDEQQLWFVTEYDEIDFRRVLRAFKIVVSNPTIEFRDDCDEIEVVNMVVDEYNIPYFEEAKC